MRGLDYYTHTAWEIKWPPLGAQSTVSGGGRYDGFAEILGGPPTPGIGFAAGIDRIVLALRGPGPGGRARRRHRAAAVRAGHREEARPRVHALLDELRLAGVRCEADLAGRSGKGQRKHADAARRARSWPSAGPTSGRPVRCCSATARAAAPRRWRSTDLVRRRHRKDRNVSWYRTHGCGELGAGLAGERVVVSGFIGRHRDHGGLIFLDVRDASGVVQVVIDPSDAPEAARPRTPRASSRSSASRAPSRAARPRPSTRASRRARSSCAARRSRCCRRPTRCRSSSTTRASTRRCASATARSTCAATR